MSSWLQMVPGRATYRPAMEALPRRSQITNPILIVPMRPIQLTATIVSAYVSNNAVPSAEIPALSARFILP